MSPRSRIVLPLLLFASHAVAQSPCPGGSGCPPQFNEKSKVHSRPSSTESVATRRLRAGIQEAESLLDGKDRAGASRILGRAMGDPGFGALPAADRRLAWTVRARIDMAEGHYVRAIEYLQKAIDAEDSDPDVWFWLAMNQHHQGKHEAAAKSFTELAERWPELLVNVDPADVYRLQAALREGSREKMDFLQTLFDARWDDPTGDASVLWHHLALMRLDRGENDLARAAIRRVVHPGVIIAMRSDKRFDALVDRDAWAFHPGRASERAVEAMRGKVEARPDDLDARVQLSYAMLDAGDHEGVLRLVDASLALSPKKDGSEDADVAPVERSDKQAWLLNNRAVALYRLGRTQEALADMERARRLSDGEGPNVSQTLNLGEFHCMQGNAADARRMADAVDGGQISDYGRMFQARLRLCAAWLARDANGMKRVFATIRKARASSEWIHLDALVMLERYDEAAQALIQLLDSPKERSDTLSALQRYRQVPPTPALSRVRLQHEALLARDDVKAAIERVGRRESYDLYPDAGFD